MLSVHDREGLGVTMLTPPAFGRAVRSNAGIESKMCRERVESRFMEMTRMAQQLKHTLVVRCIEPISKQPRWCDGW